MPTAATAIAAWEAAENLAARLYIHDAQAVTLPPLPAGLTWLDCWRCTWLIYLPALPATLTRLYCRVCPGIVSLPALPATLTHLYCSGCTVLSCLSALPTGLTNLFCGYCPELTSVPALPATLICLYCNGCQELTCLPATLPAALRELNCRGCPGLTCLPTLPATLTHLACSGCPGLTSLPILPATLTELICDGCPRLACIPALPAALTCLVRSHWMALPDACPPALTWLNNGSLVDRHCWRQQVAERHARQRVGGHENDTRVTNKKLRKYISKHAYICGQEVSFLGIGRRCRTLSFPLQPKPLRPGKRLETWRRRCTYTMLML